MPVTERPVAEAVAAEEQPTEDDGEASSSE